MGPPELGILCIFFGLPAIISAFILGSKYLNNKKLEIEKEMQKDRIKLLEEENKKLDKLIMARENNIEIEG
jgi:hypothetical protein